MSCRQHEEPSPSSEDEAFVQRIADAYAPPARTAAQRVAFQARLDERLRAERPRARLAWALGALAAAVSALVLGRGQLDGPVAVDPTAASRVATEPARPAAAGPQEDAILALAIDAEAVSGEALPADYEAIAGVFLDG